jgi:hypothetical protein
MVFKVVGRLTARFFRSIAKFFYVTFRNIIKHPVRSLLSVVVTVGVITLLVSTSAFGMLSNSSGASATVIKAIENTPEPDGKSSQFLGGLKDGKADVMYNLLSEDYKSSLKSKGITSAAIMQDVVNQKLLELTGQKDGRLKYSFIFAQGVRFSDGSVRNGFSGTVDNKGTRTSVTVILRLKDGKVVQVETDEPVLLAAFETNKNSTGKDAQLGVVSNNRSPVAEDFMKGLTTFDVEKIWDALSDTYKTQLTAKGVTRDSMAKIFDQVKTGNAATGKNSTIITYDGYAYLNTINFPNGITVHEFISVLSVSDNPRQPGYSIVMDSTNKIIRLGNDRAEDPIFTAILGRSQGQG